MKAELKNLSDLDRFAGDFLDRYPQGGVFGLSGGLGAGKTTFVKACVAELCRRKQLTVPRVTSPSYVVHQYYAIEPPVDHFDFYRLELTTAESLVEIGYWEAFERAQHRGAYLFVEWPEKATGQGLRLSAEVVVSILENGERAIEIS